jgi:transposase
MADSMHKIVHRCFPQAIRIIDRFHVQKLVHDALQEIRIAHRLYAINREAETKE